MKSAPAAQRILRALAAQHPGADTELHYRNAFELLVATMLSAQSTDARVNLVTPALFAKYPDARTMARASQPSLERRIRSTGFFRQKAKSLREMARLLVAEHDGQVPANMDALTRLPGVGRKTANVVLGHALGVPGLPVDRHVLRVANRLGIVEDDRPERVEAHLCRVLPPEHWTLASDVLILHGRRICRPTPACDACAARDDCSYFAHIVSTRRVSAPAVARATPTPPRRRTTPRTGDSSHLRTPRR